MTKNKLKKQSIQMPSQQRFNHNRQAPVVSLLDTMVDGREFESLLKIKQVNIDVLTEIRRALKDISDLRNRPNIAYMANVINPNIKAVRSIEYSDDLPFSELVNTVSAGAKNLDVILVTPGGSGTQVAKFVDKLRPKFDNVSFIIPNRQIDPKEIGNAINGSKYSVELVENYLHDYKFKNWIAHSNGTPVTKGQKRQRANEIANQLCKHSLWKTHDHGITREIAWEVCKLKITHSEAIAGLDRSIKRFWALFYWLFENTPVFKTFVSESYSLMRRDKALITQK